MSITTLIGLSFGVFPCLLFGFIMLLSLLVCEYIEEYVAKHLCAWKNRRRRGLRSVYRDFRERRNLPSNPGSHHYHYSSSSSRTRTDYYSGGPNGDPNDPDDMRLLPEQIHPTAPPPPPHLQYYGGGAQFSRSYSSGYPTLGANPANDPPPSYEECVLPRVRWQQINSEENISNPSSSSSSQPNKPSTKSSKD